MQSGRLYNKQQTVVAGTNLTDSGSQAFKRVDLANIPAATSSNLQYQGEDDSINVLSGAGGDGDVGSPDKNTQRWGWNAPSGSRIEVNDTPGGETIEVIHRSGAGVQIDADGGVYIVSQSQRGTGMSAPLGDIYISASGDVVIKGGSSLTVQTSGDLNMDVGGTFQVKCHNYNLMTMNYSATVDGPATTNITNDCSTVIGGIERLSVAGDAREQVTGTKIVDVGANYNTRVGGDNTNDVKGSSTHTITGDHTLSTKSNTKVLSAADTKVDTAGNLDMKTSGNINNDSGGSHFVHSSGPIEIATGGNFSVGAGASAIVTSADQTSIQGNDTTLLGRAAVQVGSAGPASVVGSVTDISGSTISLRTSTLLSPVPAGTPGGPQTVSPPAMPPIPGPDGPDAAQDAQDAKVMEANDIVDTLTSARKFPEYPGNGVWESSASAGLGTISHDTMPQAEEVFNEYSGGNRGNMLPSQPGESYDTLPETPIDRDPNISAAEPNTAIPGYLDMSAKISKYWTVGQIINGTTTRQRPSKNAWTGLMQQAILLANNVLDPVKEKFPDVIVTSWYRKGTTNHGTGRAIDIVVESRSMTKHAEIARLARDTLPCDQVFLERNTSGRTHVHLRVASAGSKASPRVMTCGDPRCRSRVSGINVEWLKRRAK